jgi:hypothetical protein
MVDEVKEYADEYTAWKALDECRAVNSDNPMAVAKNISLMFKLIKDALPAIEREAIRRTGMVIAPGNDEFMYEMQDLADDMHRVIIKVLKGGTTCQS